MYPPHPPICFVSSQWDVLTSMLKGLAREISRPVNKKTSAKVGVIALLANKKALRVSDQKYEAAINIDSFISIFDKERLMH